MDKFHLNQYIFLWILVLPLWLLPIVAFSVVPHPQDPEPQGFCGYCHSLVYPKRFNQAHLSWQKSTHNQVACVDCHSFAPDIETSWNDDTAHDLISYKPGVSLSKQSTEPFSAVVLETTAPRLNIKINDANCLSSGCHDPADSHWRVKKTPFRQIGSFSHDTHLKKKGVIEGFNLTCVSCHQHETAQTHFEVSEDTCNTCHFNNTAFNQDRSRCELCHQLPLKAIQAETGVESEQVPITHHQLKSQGVSCFGCHFDVIRSSEKARIRPILTGGTIETITMLGAGKVKSERCRNCHDQPDVTDHLSSHQVLHARHVTNKNARCRECHSPIQHGPQKQFSPLPEDCSTCHPNSHEAQIHLASGRKMEGIEAGPDPMFLTRVGCLGCHTQEHVKENGQLEMKASGKTCVQCHSKKYASMLRLWKREMNRKTQKSRRLENEVQKMLESGQGTLSSERLDRIRNQIEVSQSLTRLVITGNGVHNPKYASAVLDKAIRNFESLLSELKSHTE